MSTITVYGKVGCPYCTMSKNFFQNLSIPFEEVTLNPSEPDYSVKRDYLFDTFQHRSFPLIFIGKTFLGGFTELEKSYTTLRLHQLCSKIGIEIPFNF